MAIRLFGLLLVFFWALPVAPAQAQSYPYCADPSVDGVSCPDQPSAYVNAIAAAEYKRARGCAGVGPADSYVDTPIVDQGARRVTVYVRSNSGGTALCSAYRTWPEGGSCSAMPPISGGWHLLGAVGATCVNGCAYSGGSGGARIVVGGKTYVSWDGATPTGEVCSGSDENFGAPITDQQCQQIGNLTQCVKADGRHCVQASNGREFCWQPTEAGVKSAGNEAATKAPETANINPPAKPPANGGDWQAKATGTVSTSSSGGTLNQYTITYWQSTYGTEGGTGGEGEDGPGGPSAGGGATCDMASFSCSDMSSVECNQLVQTWYLRCKGVDLSGGETCDAPPVCRGNAADCYISTTLWRMRCEGISAGEGSSDAVGRGDAEIISGEGDGSEEPNLSGISEGDAQELPGLWVEKSEDSLLSKLADLDDDGFISSRSCPAAESFSIANHSFQISFMPICNLLEQASYLVLALAYWLAFRIITKPQWS